MKKSIISMFLLTIFACATVENNVAFNDTKDEFMKVVKSNDKDEINKFFVKGIKNNIILNNIKDLDLSNITLIMPEDYIKKVNNNKIYSLVIVNSGITSVYFDVIWVRTNDGFKISSINEK